jgi:hypothetical protein
VDDRLPGSGQPVHEVDLPTFRKPTTATVPGSQPRIRPRAFLEPPLGVRGRRAQCWATGLEAPCRQRQLRLRCRVSAGPAARLQPRRRAGYARRGRHRPGTHEQLPVLTAGVAAGRLSASCSSASSAQPVNLFLDHGRGFAVLAALTASKRISSPTRPNGMEVADHPVLRPVDRGRRPGRPLERHRGAELGGRERRFAAGSLDEEASVTITNDLAHDPLPLRDRIRRVARRGPRHGSAGRAWDAVGLDLRHVVDHAQRLAPVPADQATRSG